MTAMKPALDAILNANIVFLLAFCFWALVQGGILRSRLRTDYTLQVRLLRTVLLVVILTPVLTFLSTVLSQALWPKAPSTLGDLVVASYLRGEIAIPALEFERMLSTRDRLLEMVLFDGRVWPTALGAAILIGSVAFLTQTVLNLLRVRRILAQSYCWRRTGSTDIRLSDTIAVPFATRGLTRRYVVLPSHLVMHPEQLRIVLAHEFEHLRQGDVEWEFAFEALRPLLFWNPAFLLWKRSFDRLRELSCDRAVLDGLGVSPRDYAQCLLSFCGRQGAAPSAERLNVAFITQRKSGALHALETRVLALGNARACASHCLFFWASAALLASTIVLTAALIRSPSDWSQDRLMLSTIVNLERLEAINRGY